MLQAISSNRLPFLLQECTFFSKNDVIRIYKKFKNLDPPNVPNEYTPDYRMSEMKLTEMKELKENPFRERIYKVLSTDGSGTLSFDEFLDLHSVFNTRAPNGVKVAYLFQIYDFDGDCKLGRKDIEMVIQRITDETLTEEEKTELIDQALQESDLDGDEALSFYEFEQVVLKAPHFLYSFHIGI